MGLQATRDAIIHSQLSNASFPPELIHIVGSYDGNLVPYRPHPPGYRPTSFDQRISPILAAKVLACSGPNLLFTPSKNKKIAACKIIKFAIVAQKLTFLAFDCALYGVHLATRYLADRKYKKDIYEGDLQGAKTALRLGCHSYLTFSDILKLIGTENYNALILLMAQAFHKEGDPKAFDAFKTAMGLVLNFAQADDRLVLKDIPGFTYHNCFVFFHLLLRHHIPTAYDPSLGLGDLSNEAFDRYSKNQEENKIPRYFSNIFDNYLKNKDYKRAQLFLDYGWDPNQIMQACASSYSDLHTQHPLTIFTQACSVEMLKFWLKNRLNLRIEIQNPLTRETLTLMGEATKHNNLPVITFLQEHLQERSSSDEIFEPNFHENLDEEIPFQDLERQALPEEHKANLVDVERAIPPRQVPWDRALEDDEQPLGLEREARLSRGNNYVAWEQDEEIPFQDLERQELPEEEHKGQA
jgi:hypothetical protein